MQAELSATLKSCSKCVCQVGPHIIGVSSLGFSQQQVENIWGVKMYVLFFFFCLSVFPKQYDINK